jgi:hypothetical protein
MEVAACPHSYAFQIIEGHKNPSGLQSARGTECHHVWALYTKHCAARRVPADWAKFDELAIGVLGDSAPILNGIRDTYGNDWEHFYDAEILLRWVEAGIDVEGTLDGLYFLTPAKAKIEDAKTHPRPFDADTFQGKLYSFMVLMNFPEVEEVTFELLFVRYTNCRRSVTYTREDLPALRQQIVNARARQIRLHERHAAGEQLEAYPGAHCTYCPLIKGFDCPIAEFNEYATPTPQERAQFAIWVDQVNKVNRQVLRDIVDASGKPVTLEDGNGRRYEFGYQDRETKQFPLLQTLPYLFEHRDTYPEDVEWIGKLLISSTKLKSALGAKKRAITHQAVMDNAASTISRPKFGVSVPAETDEEPAQVEWEE